MKRCLQVLLVVGALMLLYVPLGSGLHWCTLDATLTSAELADQQKLHLAQRLLEKTDDSWLWLIAGIVVTAVSWTGLVLARRRPGNCRPALS